MSRDEFARAATVPDLRDFDDDEPTVEIDVCTTMADLVGMAPVGSRAATRNLKRARADSISDGVPLPITTRNSRR